MDYKKYSLEQLDNWVHDAITSAEAEPQEIYDTIKKVVEEQYYHYKDRVSKCYELLALLNGNGKAVFDKLEDDTSKKDNLTCNKSDLSPECQKAWNDFWEEYYYPEEYVKNKVNKWILPVQVDGITGECYVNLPDDLLECANLKEGDMVEYIDNKDGSFTIKKVENRVGTI
jgi:hypothetical protein